MIDQNPNQHKVATVSDGMLRLVYADTGKTRRYFSDEPSPHNSILKNIQLYGSSLNGVKFQQDEKLNPIQSHLYKEVMFGLSGYSDAERALIPAFRKVNIEARHSLAKKKINRWKQRTLSEKVDDLLTSIFPKSRAVQLLAGESDYYSDKDEMKTSFKELGISKRQIIEKLIEWKLLPQNFYQLS